MSVVLVVAAFVTVVGALVAVTARDARTALWGLVAGLVAAPLIADPPPGIAALGARAVAAFLGGYLLFVVVGRAARITRGSLVGLPAEALAAAAAFIIGFGSDGLASGPVGPPLALGAGLALVALSTAPVARAGDALRLGIALTTLMTGAELVRVGLAGTPGPLEELLTAALTLALLVTTAVLGSAAISTTEGFALREEARPGGIFEAHPVATPSGGADARIGRSWRSRRPGRLARTPRVADAHRSATPDLDPASRSADPDGRADPPAADEAAVDDVPATGVAPDEAAPDAGVPGDGAPDAGMPGDGALDGAAPAAGDPPDLADDGG